MTGAERLRKLGEKPVLNMFVLLEALPLVIDVVEAAENEVASLGTRPVVREGLTPERSHRLQVERDLSAAVTALRDALETTN